MDIPNPKIDPIIIDINLAFNKLINELHICKGIPGISLRKQTTRKSNLIIFFIFRNLIFFLILSTSKTFLNNIIPNTDPKHFDITQAIYAIQGSNSNIDKNVGIDQILRKIYKQRLKNKNKKIDRKKFCAL